MSAVDTQAYPREARIAYIALGSNMCSPRDQVQQGLERIDASPDIHILACSPWYKSAAIGPAQADYINGVIMVATPLGASELLATLQDIEHRQGRRRELHWGPRIIDLDIVLFAQSTISEANLTVPHAELCHRNFVMAPLCDIDPAIRLPDGRSVYDELQKVGYDNLERA